MIGGVSLTFGGCPIQSVRSRDQEWMFAVILAGLGSGVVQPQRRFSATWQRRAWICRHRTLTNIASRKPRLLLWWPGILQQMIDIAFDLFQLRAQPAARLFIQIQ